MRIVALWLSLFSVAAFAQGTQGIVNWKPTEGITEAEAITLVRNAMAEELMSSQDNQSCGIEEVWGLEREKDLIADFPEKRGSIFSVVGYVQGPHAEMGCSGYSDYDCRVVFSKPPSKNQWGVEYTECDVAGGERH